MLKLKTPPDELATDLNYRSWLIAIANVPYILFVVAALHYAYKRGVDASFYAPVIAVIILGFLADRSVPTGGTKVAQPIINWLHKFTPTPRARLSLAVLRYVMLALLDLAATAYLINDTGSPVSSPFSQFAAIMIILGAAMSSKIPTRVLIVIGGIAYFAIVIALAPAPTPTKAHGLSAAAQRDLFLSILTVNLAISVFITTAEK